MTSIKRSALVPYSALRMYELVFDVPAYPDFLPWCGGARFLNQTEDMVEAQVDIAYHGIHKSFTTQNRFQPGKMIEMRLLEGPFKHLHGYWQFHTLDEASSKVELDIEFAFSNPLIKMALGPVFETIANSLVEQFSQRAREIYGNSP